MIQSSVLAILNTPLYIALSNDTFRSLDESSIIYLDHLLEHVMGAGESGL